MANKLDELAVVMTLSVAAGCLVLGLFWLSAKFPCFGVAWMTALVLFPVWRAALWLKRRLIK